jgi:hypothetical protein
MQTHSLTAAPDAQFEANADLAKRLLSIAPTEASVERVFSALKINVSSLRKRCNPKTAASQVMHNVRRKFSQTGHADVLLHVLNFLLRPFKLKPNSRENQQKPRRSRIGAWST